MTDFFTIYGFCDHFQSQLGPSNSQLACGKVINIQRRSCRLATEAGERTAQVSGRFSYTALGPDDYPHVGDWVWFREEGGESSVIIEQIMGRKSVLARKAAGQNGSQIIATNIDSVLLVQSCNSDLNLRRLERYLAACGDDNLQAVLVFNKSDLLTQPPQLPFSLPPDWHFPLHLVSADSGFGLDSLSPYLQPGTSTVLIGSSGVGKSTLVNRLCQSQQKTQTIRAQDDKGRHTTTTRELFFCQNGGMIIDTPGMREFGLAEANIDASGAFSDLQSYAKTCKFRDCRHINEPGCEVLAAIETGSLDPQRLESLVKLRKEQDYYNRQADPRENANAKKRWKQIHKEMRKHPKKNR